MSEPRSLAQHNAILVTCMSHMFVIVNKMFRYSHLDLGGKDYTLMKNAIIRAERKILNTLGFVVHVNINECKM